MLKFADDTKVICPIEKEENGATLQADLDKLLDWSNKWQMQFNLDKFANKYEELYNSVRYEEQSFSSIICENTDDIKSQCIVSDVDSDCDIIHTHSITVQQIKCAISKMQSGKSDSIEQLSSDNFKNGTHMLNVYISLLFTCMLTHGIPPSGLLLSTIIPIPKNKRGNMSDSSNYRAIALSSLLCKLFDTIIIETHEDN